MANAPPSEQKNQTSELMFRIGNTSYVLGLHFNETSKLTLEDKIKKLIRRDIQRNNF